MDEARKEDVEICTNRSVNKMRERGHPTYEGLIEMISFKIHHAYFTNLFSFEKIFEN